MRKIAIIIVLLFCCFIAILFSFQKMIVDSFSNNEEIYVESKDLSSNVLKYKTAILKEMKKQGLDTKYLPVILAQVQQESSGLGIDIFQASESKYGVVGKIETVEESIEQGIKVWSRLIKLFEKNNMKVDVKLLLQTYNFGNGYFYYIKDGGLTHTKENAKKFSEKYAKIYGWSSYGDVNYPEHVLRYVSLMNSIEYNNDKLGMPFPEKKYYIKETSLYGMRFHPIDKVNKMHWGLDFAEDKGTPIRSIQDGIAGVVYDHPGWGNYVDVENDTYLSKYAHMSEVLIKNGQKIKKGDIIGLVGNTGKSKGNHLHLELSIKGERVDPMYYIDKEQFTEEIIERYLK